MCHLNSLRIFIFTQQRVECYQYLDTIGVGIANHFRQILQTVSRRLTCAKSRSTYIDGIGACLNGRLCYLLVACRREEAKRYSTMPAVTETFIECFVPYWGISMH